MSAPFHPIDYDNACIEAHYSALYEAERRRHEEACEAWDGIRQDIDQDLERALIQPYDGPF